MPEMELNLLLDTSDELDGMDVHVTGEFYPRQNLFFVHSARVGQEDILRSLNHKQLSALEAVATKSAIVQWEVEQRKAAEDHYVRMHRVFRDYD